jgi:hypothetical protein
MRHHIIVYLSSRLIIDPPITILCRRTLALAMHSKCIVKGQAIYVSALLSSTSDIEV